MRLIEERFNKYGDEFHQVERSNYCALYKRVSDTQSVEYEVIIIRHDIDGNELYPSSNEWGKYGKTIVNQERAYKVYHRCERTGTLM